MVLNIMISQAIEDILNLAQQEEKDDKFPDQLCPLLVFHDHLVVVLRFHLSHIMNWEKIFDLIFVLFIIWVMVLLNNIIKSGIWNQLRVMNNQVLVILLLVHS